MAHPTRSARKANAARRKLKQIRVAERTASAVPGAKRARIAARYPDPPRYADDGRPQPVQPACYELPSLFGRRG